MKKILVFVLSVLLMPVAMADSKEKSNTVSQPKSLAKVAKDIRKGKIEVGKDYSMNVKTGRFHIIHVNKMLMSCSSCHYGSKYKADYIAMGKDKPMRDKMMPGRLQRSTCLSCHSKGNMANAWYGNTAE